MQDMTTALFGPIMTPLEVYAFSDIDREEVPEPGSLALLGLGLAGLGLARRRARFGGESARD